MSGNNSGKANRRKLNGSSPTRPSKQGKFFLDALRGIADLPPGSAINTIIPGKHELEGNEENHIRNTGAGRSINHVNENIAVLDKGSLKNYIGIDSIERPKDPTADDSIFNICRPAESGFYELKNKSCALIINNIFNGDNSDPKYKSLYRKGAEGDTDKLEKLFSDLNVRVIMTRENVASDGLNKILEKFRGEINDEDYSSCFIIIMSHCGKSVNSILMDDLKVLDLYNDIVYEFSSHAEVKTRPKVFLVQACRSSKGPPEVPKKLEKLTSLQHVLIAHSTSPYFPAGRKKSTGALYFEVINQVFREQAKDSSLASMLYEVYHHESLKERKQYPPVELYGFRDYKFKL